MVHPAMFYAGIFLVLFGFLVGLLQRWGFFIRRPWFRHIPKFLIANGLMLPIPLHIFADGLGLFVVWLVVGEVLHHRRSRSKEPEVLPE